MLGAVLPRVALVSLVAAAAVAHADPRWPVRINLGLPIGYTGGDGPVHGFTWGFATAINAYPTRDGIALGAYAEILLDASTRNMADVGITGSYPVLRFLESRDSSLDLRLGGYAGIRDVGGSSLAAGAFTQLTLPAYLYEFRVGVRFDATIDGNGMRSTSVLFDLDVGALLAAFAAAGSLR